MQSAIIRSLEFIGSLAVPAIILVSFAGMILGTLAGLGKL